MVKVVQNSWLGGQLDFEMCGRQDFGKYAKGASVLKNFNLMKRGGITKRQGFDRIVDLHALNSSITASTKIRLVPFSYTKNSGFVLLFAPNICYAICVNSGGVFTRQEVLPGSGISAFTASEIDEFDYQQCGYRLFIAHRNHPPSEIWTTKSKLDTVIAGGTSSAFEWKKLDISNAGAGIPSITNATCTRIKANASTAGGTFTEKYRVSAVYDDEETKACSEYYGTSCVGTIDIETDTGSVIQSTTTPAYTVTSETENKSTSGSTTSTSESTTSYGAVTTTTTTAAVVGTAENSTTYYLPWVESQAITLSISAVQKTVNGVSKYPDEVRVYKKAFGYYGLIGSAANVQYADSVGKMVIGERTSTEFEVVSSNSKTRAFENTDVIEALSAPEDLTYGKADFIHATRIVIVPNVSMSRASKVTLRLGCFARLFTTFVSDNYSNPKACTLNYYGSACESFSVTMTASNGNTYYGSLSSASTSNASGTYSEDTTAAFKSGVDSETTDFINDQSFTKEFTLRSVSASIPESATITSITLESTHTDINGDKVPITIMSVQCSNTGTSSSTYTFTDKYITPDTSITPIDDDYTAPFNGSGAYPGVVCLSQQRLIFASSNDGPATIWMSAIGDFTNFAEHDVAKTDDAIEFELPITKFANINHIIDMKQLLVFNSGCEWLIGSNSTNQGITSETIMARPQSYSGSNTRLKPLICNNSVVFSERSAQSVRRFAYDITNDGFAGKDVSVLSSSIFEHNSIVDWTYQQYPMSTVWCALSDGTMASFAYMEEQDIICWATHEHGGSGKIKNISSSCALSNSMQDIGNSDVIPIQEEVFAVVVVGDRIWLERMRVKGKDQDTIYNSLCMDSLRDIDCTSSTLADRGVLLNDDDLTYVIGSDYGTYKAGDEIASYTDANALRNDTGFTGHIYEGYKFEAKMTSVFPIVGNEPGTGQFDIKSIANVGLRLMSSVGGYVASAKFETKKEKIRYQDDKDKDCKILISSTGAVTLKNCDSTNIKPYGANNRDGRVTVTQNEVWPFTILSMETDYETENEQTNANG